MQSLLNGSLLVEGESGINLCRDLAWHDLQDLLAELHEEVIQCRIDLLFNGATVLLAVLNSVVDELGVLLLLRGSEDQGWVGGSILWLVLVDCGKVTRVADNDLKEQSSAWKHFKGRPQLGRGLSGSNLRCRWPSADQERKTWLRVLF